MMHIRISVAIASVVLVLAICAIAFTNRDSVYRREAVSRRVKDIVFELNANPSNRKALDELIALSRSTYTFQATVATSGLGRIPSNRQLVVPVLLDLLNSGNGHIAREAALSIRRLQIKEQQLLEHIVSIVAPADPADDRTWFLVDAIGESEADATFALPVLLSKTGTGPSQFQSSLAIAIAKIESKQQAVHLHDGSVTP